MESEVTVIDHTANVGKVDSVKSQMTFFERSSFLNCDRWVSRGGRIKMIIKVTMKDDCSNSYIVSSSNISESGIAVIGKNDLHLGEKVLVQLRPGFSIPSEVVWRKNRKIGIRFEKNINLIDALGINFNINEIKELK